MSVLPVMTSELDESKTFSTREIVVDFLCRNHFRVTMRTDDARPYVRNHVHAVNTMIIKGSEDEAYTTGESTQQFKAFYAKSLFSASIA
ncbi:MAG: hypothetical protein ABR568_11620 [Pyrinomonadaceae bacterium]